MTDLNASLDPTERDAQAWRMLEERLEMGSIDLHELDEAAHEVIGRCAVIDTVKRVLSAVHDALAYRRQS